MERQFLPEEESRIQAAFEKLKPDFSKLTDKNGVNVLVANLFDIWKDRIVMTGFMNEEALKETIRTGYAVFWSRSRNSLWLKGETSGNRMIARRIISDCDGDTLNIDVIALGPACHTGAQTCFSNLTIVNLNYPETDG